MTKRTATTELNRDNWDVEEEPEEIGVFKKASKEDMSKRVIKVGKRRTTQPANGTNVFAGFGGFNIPNSTSNNPFTNLFSNISSNNSQSSKSEDTNTSGNDTKSNEDEKNKLIFPKATFSSDSLFSSQFKNGSNELPSKEGSKEGPKADKQGVYLSKLKGLNETLLEWIKLHIEQNPTCILSPVFTDYDNYLKEIRAERDTGQKDNEQTTSFSTFKFSKLPINESLTNSSAQKQVQKEGDISPNKDKPSPFTFGASSVTNPLLSSNTTTSFNIPTFENMKKPTTFQSTFTSGNSGSETTDGNKDGNEDEVAGEKYNLVPVVEEEALFSQRVKLFVKNDNNYADRGVGTLYIKSISGKHQVIVRADTNLGNVLLNFILNKDIPSERVGKNNVTVVCIPTPDSKPAPVPVLLRVKTEQEADKLLEVINKYKNTEVQSSD
ncbi:nuclear pore complex protein Nup50 [Cimex lectularius]|uniref:RanBD1 domain-containing protein n=1 Tax=Cimex lectularius TaxID=79782 RepID=A0A8I6RD58_CIMLE|nr:nuclear pore complex protein Nup50 [Cimex lectularius]